MDKVLYAVGSLTALFASLVFADGVRHLRSGDETAIVMAWVGGWLLIGMGALIRGLRPKS